MPYTVVWGTPRGGHARQQVQALQRQRAGRGAQQAVGLRACAVCRVCVYVGWVWVELQGSDVRGEGSARSLGRSNVGVGSGEGGRVRQRMPAQQAVGLRTCSRGRVVRVSCRGLLHAIHCGGSGEGGRVRQRMPAQQWASAPPMASLQHPPSTPSSTALPSWPTQLPPVVRCPPPPKCAPITCSRGSPPCSTSRDALAIRHIHKHTHTHTHSSHHLQHRL